MKCPTCFKDGKKLSKCKLEKLNIFFIIKIYKKTFVYLTCTIFLKNLGENDFLYRYWNKHKTVICDPVNSLCYNVLKKSIFIITIRHTKKVECSIFFIRRPKREYHILRFLRFWYLWNIIFHHMGKTELIFKSWISEDLNVLETSLYCFICFTLSSDSKLHLYVDHQYVSNTITFEGHLNF